MTVVVDVVNWLTVQGAPWWGKLEAPAQCLDTMAREKIEKPHTAILRKMVPVCRARKVVLGLHKTQVGI